MTLRKPAPAGAQDGDLPVPAPAAAWRRILGQAIAADPSGKEGVAQRLGVSRCYVSRVWTGHIPAPSAKFVTRVVALLAQVECPHLGRMLAPEACRAYAERGYERIRAPDVPHWRACRNCEHNPLRRLAAVGVVPEPIEAPAAAAPAPDTEEQP